MCINTIQKPLERLRISLQHRCWFKFRCLFCFFYSTLPIVPIKRKKCGLTNTVLVAGLVSISLSDSVPLDWLRWAATLLAGPSPAVLLRSLSAPRVSPELLLIYRWSGRTLVRQHYTKEARWLTISSVRTLHTVPVWLSFQRLPSRHSGANDWSDLKAVRTGCELAVPYHCAGLRVLAGAPGQDGRLRTGHRFCVALLEPQSQETERDTFGAFEKWQFMFVCIIWLHWWCWPLDGNGVLVYTGEVGTSQVPQVLVNYLKKIG